MWFYYQKVLEVVEESQRSNCQKSQIRQQNDFRLIQHDPEQNREKALRHWKSDWSERLHCQWCTYRIKKPIGTDGRMFEGIWHSGWLLFQNRKGRYEQKV